MEKERILAQVEENAYKLRIKLGFTQRDFAHLLGVSASYVSNWENGYNEIPVAVLNKICNLGNVSFDYMLGITKKNNLDVDKLEVIDKKYLGKMLRSIRKMEGLTQEKMARKIHTYRFLISRTADLKEICETFGYSADWCVGKRGVCIRYKPVKKIEAKEVKKLISN